MSAIRTTVTGGKIVLDAPPDWPDGTPVEVRPVTGDIGCTEDEQGDDPESIAAWIAWLDSLPRLVLSPAEEAERAAWQKRVKDYNVEAVRRQMEEGIP